MLDLDDEDLDALARLRSVRILDLSECPIHDDDVYRIGIDRFNLQFLSLDGTEITDKLFSSAESGWQVSSLSIQRTSVGPEGLTSLLRWRCLKEVAIGPHLSDADLQDLNVGESIRAIRFVNCTFSAKVVESFQRRFPSVRVTIDDER